MSDRTAFTFTSGLVIGVALVILGVVAWAITDFASITALIPAIVGIIVVAFASIGRETASERMAIYGIAAMGALAVLGSLRAVPEILTLVTGGSVDSTVAVVSQGVMILLGLALVVVAVRAVVTD